MAKQVQPQIKSIMREKFALDTEKVRKLTIDLTKTSKFNVIKFIKYIGKHKQHITQTEMEWALGVLRIPWGEQCLYPSKLLYSAGTSNWNKDTISNANLLTYSYTKKNVRKSKDEVYYTIVDTSDGVSARFNGQLMGRNFTPYNLTVIYAAAKVFDLLSEDELWDIYNEYGKDFVVRFRGYTAEDNTDEDNHTYLLQYFISTLLLLKGSEHEPYLYNKKLYDTMYKHILEVHDQELNILLMNDYAKGLSGDYARAFQTKKNIPVKILEAMQKSEFLKQGFHFVEYDEDTDLTKVSIIAKEWEALRKKLPLSTKTTELRFRKLGNYRAYGVYFPYINCMSVDLRHINSFIHEYAHHLDYTYASNVLSVQEDFLPIIQAYRTNWAKVSKKNKDVVYTVDQKQYYTTPTEIFARGYEVYLTLAGLKTNLLKTKEVMAQDDAYKAFLVDEELLLLVKAYYQKVFS